MDYYEESFPNLEINTKKSCSNSHKMLKKRKNSLVSPIFTSSQLKAYNFFNNIVKKTRNNMELINNNHTNINLGNFLEISNYKKKNNSSNQSDLNKKKQNSNIVKIILNDIRRKTPKNIEANNYLTIDNENSSEHKNLKKDRILFFKYNNNFNFFTTKKSKNKNRFLNRNILPELFDYNKYNIKSFSKNRKIFIFELEKENGYNLNKNNKNIFRTEFHQKSSSFNKENKKNGLNDFNDSLLRNKIIKKNGEKLLVFEKNILSNINTISKFEKNIHLMRMKKFKKPKIINYKFKKFFKEHNNNNLFNI